MELDRHHIERKDFSVVRRGYDQEEVDLHLRELADAITELKTQLKSMPAGVAGAAAEQVRQIVEAAEESASQIEKRANDEARRVTQDAAKRAQETHERADREAAEQLERVQEAVAKMLDRAGALERELESMMEEVSATVRGIVDRIRRGAGDLGGELESIRSELGAVRPEREPEPEPEPEAAAAAEEEPEPAVTEREPEPEEELAPAAAAAEPVADAEATPTKLPTANSQLPTAADAPKGAEGARLVALNMALNGTPREEAARYLAENFELDDQDAILDDVYARLGGRN